MTQSEGLDIATLKRLLALGVWIHPPIIAGLAWMAGTQPLVAGALSAALALLTTLAGRRDDLSAHLLLAVALVGQPALMTGALAGHPWQIDAHMYFFAVLAILSALADERIVIAGAGAVALHHLGLNFSLPVLLFPGGADSARVLFHAVIVVIEAAFLVMMIRNRLALQTRAEAEAEAARAAAEEVKAAEARSMLERDRVMETLEAEFSAVVDRGLRGDFSTRIETRFDDPVLTRLAAGVNGLYDAIDGSLAGVEARLTQLAAGDLGAEMTDGAEGRFREMRDRMNETVRSLRALISGVAQASGDAQGAAERIRSESRQLSEQSGEQAAAVEETAAALEQISASVRSNADLLDEAEGMARGAVERTEHGEAASKRTVGAVNRIKDSSDKITAIISMIEGIAFQTNLLALNAAVEAARAGEAGSGFAVVASEVRALAQRTTEAAAEVGGLVRESGAAVADGVKTVEETGAALAEIGEAVRALIVRVGEVARSGREQSGGVGEVGAAVSRIDGAIQRNAASAQSAADAAEDLAAMVARLDEMVAGFRNGEGDGRARLAG